MTYSTDPAKNRAVEHGEVSKIRWEALGWCQGVGLDLGCGPWKISGRAIGIDSSRDHRGNMNGDVQRLPLIADACMDYVFSSHTLEDLKDYKTALAEWWRVLKVGGHLVLYLPHADFYPRCGERDANPAHKHDFLPEDIVQAQREIAPHWTLRENQERDEGDEYSFFQVFRKNAEGGQTIALEETDPAKRAIVIRYGGFGDVLVAGSTFPHIKAEGWHLTVVTGEKGQAILEHDPHVDRVINIGNVTEMTAGDLRDVRAYWRGRCHRFVDFSETFEGLFLANPNRANWHWKRSMRQKYLSGNYLEGAHDAAGVPQVYRQKFHASAEELKEAREFRRSMPRCVVLSSTGSGINKIWPHQFEFASRLVDRNPDLHLVVLGDLKGGSFVERDRLHVLGETWTMRRACAFVQVADLVIGPETGLLNAVAFEPMPKIVLLSHSGPTQLTRDWVNTQTLIGEVICYPCHRLHVDWAGCRKDLATGFSACASMIKPMHAVHLTEQMLGLAERIAA